MQKEVMVTAWDIAKEAVKQFGGKAIEYISESLRLAWAKIKGGNKMKGSEKQVAWAEDIKVEVIKRIDEMKTISAMGVRERTIDEGNRLSTLRSILFGGKYNIGVSEIKRDHRRSGKETKEEKKERFVKMNQAIADFEQELIQDILKQDEARYWIDNFKSLT